LLLCVDTVSEAIGGPTIASIGGLRDNLNIQGVYKVLAGVNKN
jgi:hypothetical protein